MANPRTIARLEARILERAAHCLEFEIRDPRSSFVTVTRVELSSDLMSGKIFYSVLGDRSDRSKVEHMLSSGAAGFVQRQVAKVLNTRRVPHLTWHFDDTIEYAARMDQVIQRALQRDEEIQSEGRAEEPPEDDGPGEPQRPS